MKNYPACIEIAGLNRKVFDMSHLLLKVYFKMVTVLLNSFPLDTRLKIDELFQHIACRVIFECCC